MIMSEKTDRVITALHCILIGIKCIFWPIPVTNHDMFKTEYTTLVVHQNNQHHFIDSSDLETNLYYIFLVYEATNRKFKTP